MVGEIWGCGSFSNDPKLMAKLFDKALRRLDSEFNEIEFAVFGSKINRIVNINYVGKGAFFLTLM